MELHQNLTYHKHHWLKNLKDHLSSHPSLHCHHIHVGSIDLRISRMPRLRFGVTNICPSRPSRPKDALDICLGLKIQAFLSKDSLYP